MRLLRLIFGGPEFSSLNAPIEKLKGIRDSYRAINVSIYGEEMAKLLNDW